jgi:hypothetical protein
MHAGQGAGLLQVHAADAGAATPPALPSDAAFLQQQQGGVWGYFKHSAVPSAAATANNSSHMPVVIQVGNTAAAHIPAMPLAQRPQQPQVVFVSLPYNWQPQQLPFAQPQLRAPCMHPAGTLPQHMISPVGPQHVILPQLPSQALTHWQMPASEAHAPMFAGFTAGVAGPGAPQAAHHHIPLQCMFGSPQ